jgi:hypothetical protein
MYFFVGSLVFLCFFVCFANFLLFYCDFFLFLLKLHSLQNYENT